MSELCLAVDCLLFLFQNFDNHNRKPNTELFANQLLWSIGYSHIKKCSENCNNCTKNPNRRQIFSCASQAELGLIVRKFCPTAMPFFVEIISAYEKFDPFWILKIDYTMYSIKDVIILTEKCLINEIYSTLPQESFSDLFPRYKTFLLWLYEKSESKCFVHLRTSFHRRSCTNFVRNRDALIKNQSYSANEKSLDEFIVNDLLERKLKGKYYQIYQEYIDLVKRATFTWFSICKFWFLVRNKFIINCAVQYDLWLTHFSDSTTTAFLLV